MGATIATYAGAAVAVAVVMVVFVTIGWGLGGAVEWLAQIPNFWRFAGGMIGGVIGIRLLQKAFVEV